MFYHQCFDIYSQSCHIYSGFKNSPSKTGELLVTVLSMVNIKKKKKNWEESILSINEIQKLISV